MRIINGDDVSRYASPEQYNIEKERTKEFIKAASCCPTIWWDLLGQWMRVLNVLDYNIEGKSLLDIGCGSNGKTVESRIYGEFYQPWFSRFIYKTRQYNKLNIFGVDKGDLTKEEFPHLQLNLLKKNVLIENFEKNSFDIITAFRLFNSPELEKENNGKRVYNASKKSSNKLMNILNEQIIYLLKPEGIFLYYGFGEEESEEGIVL